MRTYESLLALIAELDGDAIEMSRVHSQNLRAWERLEANGNDALDWGALAFTLHTLYGIAENYFLRVSRYFENSLPSDRWHKALVEKMALDIPLVRPPLLTATRDKLDALELLKFRHRIRNLYGEDLDPVKTAQIQAIAGHFFGSFPETHAEFRGKLLAMAQQLNRLS
jgi:hypothetical protein